MSPALAAVDKLEEQALRAAETVLNKPRGAHQVSIDDITAMAWMIHAIVSTEPETQEEPKEDGN